MRFKVASVFIVITHVGLEPVHAPVQWKMLLGGTSAVTVTVVPGANDALVAQGPLQEMALVGLVDTSADASPMNDIENVSAKMGENCAVTVVAALSDTSQAPVPVHAPPL